MLDVNLMNDTRVGRHDLEIAESRLPPAQKTVTLAIAVELNGVVTGERLRRSVLIDLHRVIDDQLDRRERIDLLRTPAELDHRVAHRREVYDHGNSVEILQNDS